MTERQRPSPSPDTERGDRLRDEFLKPSAKQLYIRLLHGGDLLNPDVSVEEQHTRQIPPRPIQAYTTLQEEWVGERQSVKRSIDSWATSAGKATVLLIERAEPGVAKVLKKAFNGWGVKIGKSMDGEAIQSGFANEFYQQYCGNNMEEGIGKMATQLIRTFVATNTVGREQWGITQLERDILTVLDSMQGWLTKFYGKESLQQAFVACVKAELAMYAKKLNKVDQKVVDATLAENEKAVLKTLAGHLPQDGGVEDLKAASAEDDTSASAVIPDEDLTLADVAPSVGATSSPEGADESPAAAHAPIDGIGAEETEPEQPDPTRRSIPASALVEPEVAEAVLGQRNGTIIGVEPRTLEEKQKETEDRIKREHDKLGNYFGLRLQLIAAISDVREGRDEIQLDTVQQALGVRMGDLAPKIIEMGTGKLSLPDLSGVISEIFEESHFLSNTNFTSFGIFHQNATYEMRLSVVRVLEELFPDKRNLFILPNPEKAGRARMNEEEIRDLVIGIMKRFGVSDSLRRSYEGWIEKMKALPLYGDQLAYLVDNDHRIAAAYKHVRDEMLEKALRRARGEKVDEEGQDRRMSPEGIHEGEPDDAFSVPPMPDMSTVEDEAFAKMFQR